MDKPVPDVSMSEEEVEGGEFDYSDRAPGDFIISGPLGLANSRGHWFETAQHALRWAQIKYGDRLKGRIREAEAFGDRWAFLIKGP